MNNNKNSNNNLSCRKRVEQWEGGGADWKNKKEQLDTSLSTVLVNCLTSVLWNYVPNVKKMLQIYYKETWNICLEKNRYPPTAQSHPSNPPQCIRTCSYNYPRPCIDWYKLSSLVYRYQFLQEHLTPSWKWSKDHQNLVISLAYHNYMNLYKSIWLKYHQLVQNIPQVNITKSMFGHVNVLNAIKSYQF